MVKTVLVIISVLLALACGALGLELLKSAAETQTLNKKLADMEAGLKEQISASETQKQQLVMGKTSLEEVRLQLSSLSSRIRSIETRLDELEKKTETSAQASATEPGSRLSAPDLEKMTPEERVELEKVIREEITRQQRKRAEAFKEAMIENIQSRMDAAAEKLDLSTLQKIELNDLLSSQVNKGFEMAMQAFQEGDMQKARSEIQKVVEETDEKVKEILYPYQIEKLKELDPDGFGRREQRRLQGQDE